MITIHPDLVSLILTVLIPVATGVITKAHASQRVKATVGLILAGIVALITTSRLASGAAVLSTQTLVQWALALTVSLATEFGVYRPIAPKAMKVLPNLGIGPRAKS